MTSTSLSRRSALGAGIGSFGAAMLTGRASAASVAGWEDIEDVTARTYYRLWEKRDWAPFDTLLAADFTFTSANDDDHISKVEFKQKCWETQAGFISHFDVEALATRPGEAFVKYLCHTTNDRSFRNVEYLRIRDDRVMSIECYFGGKSTFASAVGSK